MISFSVHEARYRHPRGTHKSPCHRFSVPVWPRLDNKLVIGHRALRRTRAPRYVEVRFYRVQTVWIASDLLPAEKSHAE